MGILDFLSHEAGQQRRRALDETLGNLLDINHYIPPNSRDRAASMGNLLAMLNPVNDMEQAVASGRQMIAPGQTPGQRFGHGLDMTTNALAVAAPVAGFKYADDAVDAGRMVVDAFTGFDAMGRQAANNVADAGRRFAADESGNVPLASITPEAKRGEEILSLLKSGNGDKVTDEMLDMGDPVANAKLNQYLFENYDLPMDTPSRMARAEEMGADPLTQFYHGTAKGGFVDTTDINAFDPNRVGDRWNADKKGFSITSSIQDANYYARPSDPGYAADGTKSDFLRDGAIYPLEDLSKRPYHIKPMDQYQGTIGAWDDRPEDTYEMMEAANADSARIYSDGTEMRVVMDPANIRSRFARFDPRLSHLRNLSAGVGGAGLLSYLASPDDEQNALRDYLGI